MIREEFMEVMTKYGCEVVQETPRMITCLIPGDRKGVASFAQTSAMIDYRGNSQLYITKDSLDTAVAKFLIMPP